MERRLWGRKNLPWGWQCGQAPCPLPAQPFSCRMVLVRTGGRVRGGCTGCACPYRCARRGGMPTTESRPPSRPSWDKARPHLGTDLTSAAPTSAPPSPASPRAPPGPRGGSEGRKRSQFFGWGGTGIPAEVCQPAGCLPSPRDWKLTFNRKEKGDRK